MSPKTFKPGFSLTEVLMAAGILLVGFLLIAGTFPVGVKLTALATERTIGVVASEEAMAKIHLYGIDNPAQLPYNRHIPYDGVSVVQYQVATNASSFISSTVLTQLSLTYQSNPSFSANPLALERYFQAQSLYPSTVFFDYSVPASPQIKTDPEDPQRYFWSAMCRRLDSTSTEIQVTIFVCRMAGQGAWYPQFNFRREFGFAPAADSWSASKYPTPVPVRLQTVVGSHIAVQQGTNNIWNYYFQKLSFFDAAEKAKAAYITKGAILLDDVNGRLMRVLEVRYPDATDLGEIILFRPVDSDNNLATVVDSDGDGMLLVAQGTTLVPPATGFSRWVWLIPPAQAAAAPGGATPPKVAGRNPCVGVFQGQL
jgi:hypothetical protein